jgi:hypothetical protein
MNRPWLYAEELLPRFAKFTNADNLRARLRQCYPTVVELEKLANERRIPIHETFQGAVIGLFHVMAPSRQRFLNLVVDSERTPEAAAEEAERAESLVETITRLVKAAVSYVRAAWGEEVFLPNPTSRENEMSVVQYANFNGKKFLLTGDAGREALAEVIVHSPAVALTLPGIDYFQVPHHGSRRNVDSDTLDVILGPRLPSDQAHPRRFYGSISSAKADPDHPRKAVKRAINHRGGGVIETEGVNKVAWINAPARAGWTIAEEAPYPEDQEA